MSKTCKKLLASALAVTMLFSTFVTSLVVSAATPGSLNFEATTTVVEGKDAAVAFKLTFTDPMSALHMLTTITSDLKIADVTLGDVTYVTAPVDPEVPELESPALRIDTKNLDAGKILFESGIAGAVEVTEVNFTVTFDTDALAVGEKTFAIAVEFTNYDEANFDVIEKTGKVVVEAAAPECDHADAKLIYSVVDGACVTTRVCDCGEYEEVIATVAAERTGQDTGLRIFRAPILDAGLALAFRTLTASSAGYTDVYGVFTKDVYERDGGNTLTTPEVTTINAVIDPDYGGARYKFLYEGIRSYEMCSNINIKIYGTNADGYVCLLGVLDYAFATYIQNNYAAASGTLKTLLGDLAFYGAAAQDYFEYRYDTKPNAGFENEHTALPTTFDTTDNTLPGGITISKAPDLANKVMIVYRFQPSAVASYGDDIRFEVDYIDAKGNPATFVKNYDEFETHTDGRHQIVFDQLVAAHINDVVTAKVVDSDGTIIGQLEYTLEKYAYNRYSGADNGKPLCILTQALVNYGDAAAAHFGK